MTSSLDLAKLLPPRYRDKTIDSLLKNLFNRHVSKQDTVPIFGYVGSTDNLVTGDVSIVETDLERQMNQLTPLIYSEHASEKQIFSWPDLVQKMTLLGIDYAKIGSIFNTKSYNFAPPIDLDKFSNYSEYFWVGNWIRLQPTLPWKLLGIAKAAVVDGVMEQAGIQDTYAPAYYVIERGPLDSNGDLESIAPNLPTWSDWSISNLWVHREDAINFLVTYSGFLKFDTLVQAKLPIIEYSRNVSLNTFQDVDGVPSDSGTYVTPKLLHLGQPPLFNLYDQNGVHLGATSSLFYFSESPEYSINEYLQRRLVLDSNDDFVFEHSLVDTDTGALRFYTLFGTETRLSTIWNVGPLASPSYVKYDLSGSLIDQDKFTNFKNYFWTGVDEAIPPAYNPTGLPEYNCIEKGGLSGWSVDNHWTHVNTLKRSELKKYVQAVRPIIEFNKNLESELLETKVSFQQLPKFKYYRFDKLTNSYIQTPSGSTPETINLNDAYVQNHLLVRLSDLPEIEAVIKNTPEILTNTFEYNNERYIQGLYTGVFVPERDGVVYGYRTSITYDADFCAGLTVSNIDSVCTPENIVMTWNALASQFTVRGTVTGAHVNLTMGIPYTVSGVTFTMFAGAVPIENGDQFIVEIKSFVYEQKSLYVFLDGSFRTLSAPSKIIDELPSNDVIGADLTLLDGAWNVPPQLEWNALNETRATIKQGDLYYHFTSIIKSQPDLVGSEAGKNNWRNLTNKNLGLGGTIKQYDGDVALLVSMLLQDGITPSTLLDFARESYENVENSLHRFIEHYVPLKLAAGGSISVDELYTAFKEFYSSTSVVVATSPSTIDNNLATPFYDSTSSINNVVVTLPYLGLATLIQPRVEFDTTLGFDVIVSHDGHRRALPKASVETLKSLVTKEFLRSPGQTTPGFITGSTAPVNPYMCQFWFKTTTMEVFYYNVISDTNEQPLTAAFGAFTYDRPNNRLYQFNGIWNLVSDLNMPWTLLDLGSIETQVLLELETELYTNCPPLTPLLNTIAIESDSSFNTLMQAEFENFGLIYGAPDVYSSNYDSANAFTWNYGSVVAISAAVAHTTWNKIYEDVYSTPRPDIQPWIPAGYVSEDLFIADLITASIVPGGTTKWDVSYWSAAAAFIKAKYLTQGITDRLSVNVSTGALLPPYASGSAESLVLTVPDSAANSFPYGSYGPIETFWRKTANYLYSLQKVYFKIDPRNYLSSTWGIKQTTVGDYTFNSMLIQKNSPAKSQFHGDTLSELINNDWIEVLSVSPPSSTEVYTVECVSRLESIFKVVSPPETVYFSGHEFYNGIISVILKPTARDFFNGDKFVITLTSVGGVTVESVPCLYFKAEGLNQFYIQYNRVYGKDQQISLNRSLFTNWIPKLGYRFSGFVNTDLLSFNSNGIIDQSAYSVYLKENKFYDSAWINALRVQVVQRGSTTRDGSYTVPSMGVDSPGEDWVFRVDNFNPSRSGLSWYEADTTADAKSFIALDGKRTVFPWNRYPASSTVLNYNVPFLITGLQNLINFIFGYEDFLVASGWRFDQPETTLDASTGRTLNYQVLMEKFIVLMFSGATAGASFVFNPFSRIVHFTTPRGIVSNFNDILGLEQETVCTILDVNGHKVPSTNIRVFRQDAITEIVSDIPLHTLHLLVSEYEHVVLFENYSVDNLLVYDAFLGQRSRQMFITGEKQSNFTGRLDFGGHYMLGDQMKRNLENSVDGILKLYDTNSTTNPEVTRARGLLGFAKKDYFANRETSDVTEFRFWQGMIANKGTNFAVDAYTNSAKYTSTRLDEYWAYKVADYGDARARNKPELKVESEDAVSEITNYLFAEDDDLATFRNPLGDGYDIPDYDIAPYDGTNIFNPNTFYEYAFDPSGSILITPNSETRWFRYVDLKVFQYFDAAYFVKYTFVPTSMNDLYEITDPSGKPVRADVFEIIDTTLSAGFLGGYDDAPYGTIPYDYSSNDQVVYRETGDYIIGTDPAEYSDPKFERVNHHTIRILDPDLIGRRLRVIGYCPAFSKYSPVHLYNYVSNTTVKDDIIWWDPARGIHHPQAIASVDYELDFDPAKYNVSNQNQETIKPWGELEVGKVWWNKTRLAWKPYSDTKLIPDLNDRLSQWGAISDLSSMEVYEWVKSTTPPVDYADDGVPAINKMITRTRTWLQRPVAWRYSQNPSLAPRSFQASQPTGIKFNLAASTATLKTGSFTEFGLTKGYKISAAVYEDAAKLDSELKEIFGLAQITSDDPFYVIGTALGYDDGASFVVSPYFTFELQLVNESISFRADNLGQYLLDSETDANGVLSVKLTHVNSGNNQILEVVDTPVKAGAQYVYDFDQFGIKLNVTALYGIGTAWPSLGTPNISVRKSTVASAIGQAGHEIYVRSSINVFIPIAFAQTVDTVTVDPITSLLVTTNPVVDYPELPVPLAVFDNIGWISWKDPEVNPIKDSTEPHNKYTSFLGNWTPIGSALMNLSSDIETRLVDKWVGFDGTSYSPYMSVWSTWTDVLPMMKTLVYNPLSGLTDNEIFQTQLTFPGISESELQARATVYINEKRIYPSVDWITGTTLAGVSFIKVKNLKQLGASIKVTIDNKKILPADLAFDPSVKEDPLKLVQYKKESPYVLDIRRDEYSNLTVKNYYFWVKNKSTPAKIKKMSVKQIATLLEHHNDLYSVPQVIKFYNQLDGRPNRYALLSLNNLGRYVKHQHAYKLRLSKNPALRNDDNDIKLKNIHEEWKLLRPFQSTKIPKNLWDLLTNTLCGENELNQALPSGALELYDSRNGSQQRYGFTTSQIFADAGIAKTTLKYTILNTRVDKYENGTLVPDYISYPGFNSNLLSTYLATPASIRSFMSDLWRFAKAKQINEIFFAVLQDAVEKNLELTDFFKTSFVSVSEIRTLGQS